LGNKLIPMEFKSQRILTTEQLAEAYGTDINNIQSNFKNHKENFSEGKHYYFLQGEELKKFKSLLNNIQTPISKFASSLYLWTERGVNRHCKILDTDMAWQQFDNLEETYFRVKEKQILILPTNYKEALLQLVKAEEDKEVLALEGKQKDQLIGELKPRADYTDNILKNTGLVTITQIAKDYGMTAHEMNTLLHDFKIQYKQSEQWLLYANHHDKGYTHSETIPITRSDGRFDVKMITKWTQKGRLFLYNLLKDDEILPTIENKEGI